MLQLSWTNLSVIIEFLGQVLKYGERKNELWNLARIRHVVRGKRRWHGPHGRKACFRGVAFGDKINGLGRGIAVALCGYEAAWFLLTLEVHLET